MKRKISMDQALEEKLSAWLDGELPEEETRLLFDAFKNLPSEDKAILKSSLYTYTVIKNQLNFVDLDKVLGSTPNLEAKKSFLDAEFIPRYIQLKREWDSAWLQRWAAVFSKREWLGLIAVCLLAIMVNFPYFQSKPMAALTKTHQPQRALLSPTPQKPSQTNVLNGPIEVFQ